MSKITWKEILFSTMSFCSSIMKVSRKRGKNIIAKRQLSTFVVCILNHSHCTFISRETKNGKKKNYPAGNLKKLSMVKTIFFSFLLHIKFASIVCLVHTTINWWKKWKYHPGQYDLSGGSLNQSAKRFAPHYRKLSDFHMI